MAKGGAPSVFEPDQASMVEATAMNTIVFHPIGIIHSPFTRVADMPIQPKGAIGIRGRIELFPEFADGLKDLGGFSHIFLLYHFHRAAAFRLRVVPFLDREERGVFATRAPARPNPIGLSVVHLLGVRANDLEVENLDVLDGTPLLDIKPYVPEFDDWKVESTGWLASRRRRAAKMRSDDRFQ
jgi:tRNA (adenine37-N6)-methyltransferase